MPARVMMSLHGVTYRATERQDVGPIHLQLLRRQRVLLRCESGPAYDGLIGILTGKNAPLSGRIIELERVRVQTDRHLRELCAPAKSIRELLNENPLPDTIWIGERRRSTQTVMDRLGLEPHHFRLPLKLEPKEAAERFWALRFVCSNADLLIGREIFELEDETIRRVLRDRWADFPGIVICAAPERDCPGPTDTVVAIEPDGSVHSEPAAAPAGHTTEPPP
jgi:hypothetical protein